MTHLLLNFELRPMGIRARASVKSKGHSHADSGELINGVLQHICAMKLMIGYSPYSPRNVRC